MTNEKDTWITYYDQQRLFGTIETKRYRTSTKNQTDKPFLNPLINLTGLPELPGLKPEELLLSRVIEPITGILRTLWFLEQIGTPSTIWRDIDYLRKTVVVYESDTEPERVRTSRENTIGILTDLESILDRCVDEEDEIETENFFFLAEDKIRDLWELRDNVEDYTSDVFSLLIDFCLMFNESPLTKDQLTFISDIVKDLRESELRCSFSDYEELLKKSCEHGLDSSRLTRIDGGW